MNTKENILAIPSKDRLRDETLKLLRWAEFDLEIPGRQLTVDATLRGVGSFTVALMRPKDIIERVGAGEIPAGIVGLDTLEETKLMKPSLDSWKAQNVEVLLKLGIGRCRLALAVPEESFIKSSQDLIDEVRLGRTVISPDGREYPFKRAGILPIATSFPGLTQRYFQNIAITSSEDPFRWMGFWPRDLTGSVEIAPALGIADVIADLVETGQSLKDNGLREVMTIFESQAVLIAAYESDRRGNSFIAALRRRLARTLS